MLFAPTFAIMSSSRLSSTGVASEFYRACRTADTARVVDLFKTTTDLRTAPLSVNGDTALHVAVDHNRVSITEVLLEAGAAVDAPRQDGFTPLCVAVAGGHVSAARLLVRYKANVNVETRCGETPLRLAAAAGDERSVRVLLDGGAEIEATDRQGYTALLIAAMKEKRRVEEFLLSRLANVNAVRCDGWTALHLEAFAGHLTMCRSLLRAGAAVDACADGGWTPLIVAASEGHEAVVCELLSWHANVNAKRHGGFTSLYVAAEAGAIDVVAELLAAEAAVDAAIDDGSTPISIAAHNGHVDVVRVLLDAGAAPGRCRRDGWTPLMLAALLDHGPVAKALVASGKAAVYQRLPLTDFRRSIHTALHVAAEHNSDAVLRVLLDGKVPADGGVGDVDGAKTPLMLSAAEGNTAAVRWLLDAGADVHATAVGVDGCVVQVTALSEAAAEGHESAVEVLLQAAGGASVPLSMLRDAHRAARANGHIELARRLQNRSLMLSPGGNVAREGRGGEEVTHGESPPRSSKRRRSEGALFVARRGGLATASKRPLRSPVPAAATVTAAATAAVSTAASAGVRGPELLARASARASPRAWRSSSSHPVEVKPVVEPPAMPSVSPAAVVSSVSPTATAAQVAAAFVEFVGTGFTTGQAADLAAAVIPVAVAQDLTGAVATQEDPAEMVTLLLADYKGGTMPWGAVRRGRRFFAALQEQT